MANSIDAIIPVIIEANPKLYSATDVIQASDVVDPLARVVPCFADKREAFYPFVCNIVVFTKLMLNASFTWDTTQHPLTKAMLIEMFPKFARYELHFWVDSASSDVITSTTQARFDFKNKLTALAAELVDYNVFFHGEKQADQLKNEIDQVIADFKAAIREET